jgi:hypothetical protein
MKEHGFKQRLLGSLKGTDIPKVFLFTDTETHAEVHELDEVQRFTLGWIFTWHSSDAMNEESVTQEYFTEAELYCKYFESSVKKNESIVIAGHNIFFDLQCAGFFKYFTAQGWQLDWLYDKGLTYILRIRMKRFKILVLSSTNYYDCTLKKLGYMIEIEKKEIDFEHCTTNKLAAYCHQDTMICMQAVWFYIRFIRTHNLGRMAYTKSSQSFISYRTRFMNHKIYLHGEERVFNLERAAYMGGRTEAYRIGVVPGNDFVLLDVNGMYPYVMRDHKYPSKMVCYMEDEEDKRYTDVLRRYGMIAEVELDTPEPAFGVRYRNKLIFPTGQIRATLCTGGLRYAYKKGYIKRFVRASVYLMDDLFSDYTGYFQDLKEKYQASGNFIMSKLCKYMLNSLYGKFGEKEIITHLRPNRFGPEYLRREIWDAVAGGWWTETYFMNQIIMQHSEGESYHSFPAVAAHITENARMALWSIIGDIGPERVLYCDTDSIIIHSTDLERVTWPKDDFKLGALKIQERFSELRIDGAKNYRTDNMRKIKGIPENAVEITPGVFRYDSFERQISCMRSGQITGVKITPVTRRLTTAYDKGVVGKDGVVTPHHFSFFEPLP